MFFFATDGVDGGQKTISLEMLVTKTLINFKNIAGQKVNLETRHANHIYHKRVAEQGTAFLRIYNKPNLEVLNLAHQQRFKEVEENREQLRLKVEIIIFLGRQNL